jgi:ATP-dependent DNA helicase RecG
LLTGNKVSDESYKRIQIMVSTTDGFKIAEQDLAMRGPGDIYGTRQSGEFKFKLADIVQDAAILEQTRHAALQLIAQDPGLTMPQHYGIKSMLKQQNRQSHWGKIS